MARPQPVRMLIFLDWSLLLGFSICRAKKRLYHVSSYRSSNSNSSLWDFSNLFLLYLYFLLFLAENFVWFHGGTIKLDYLIITHMLYVRLHANLGKTIPITPPPIWLLKTVKNIFYMFSSFNSPSYFFYEYYTKSTLSEHMVITYYSLFFNSPLVLNLSVPVMFDFHHQSSCKCLLLFWLNLIFW